MYICFFVRVFFDTRQYNLANYIVVYRSNNCHTYFKEHNAIYIILVRSR
jgi:hypothetical protein